MVISLAGMVAGDSLQPLKVWPTFSGAASRVIAEP